MDGMLSQDEINALLSGMNAGSSDPQPDPQPAATEEILTDIEKDAIGEIANISMGTSATTLYSLVNRKVNITTPTVSIANWKNFIDEQEKPCVFIQIKYTEGLDGANILIMRERDVKVITDLMMGGDGSNIDGELGELHLSAISEAMNQMMGSSATSLSSMLGRMIDISPPEASLVNILENKNGADIAPFLGGDFVKIEFRMQIEDLVDSTIMQLYPIDFAKSLYKIFMEQQMGTSAAPAQPDPAPQPQSVPAPQPQPAPAPQPQPQPYVPPQAEMPQMQQAMPQMQMQQAMPQMQMQQMPQMQQANIQPAQFQAFNTQMPQQMASQENIGLIMDVPLEVTVELGRTKKSIAEILDFTPGTIIELDKIAGEPIDVLVNGKFVAKGEVVVIEESFGIRVTEIIK
ncbi:MAG: flagellar motor switch phosphatase FliY [Lachnospiraceae bacterium]|nr:flagellar motor switch phosphatase FliY [Lachnospiraceae bacterium]